MSMYVKRSDGLKPLATFPGPKGADGDTVANLHASQASGAHNASAINYAGGTSLPASTVEAALDTLDTRSRVLTDQTGNLNELLMGGRYYVASVNATAGNNAPVPGTAGVLDVDRNSNGNAISQTYSLVTGGEYGKIYVRRTIDGGATWTAWRDLTGTITGTGNPNGTVSAPIGTRFVNTEEGGYNGARVWRKDSGAGTTGWVVAEGDTGWRKLVGWVSGSVTDGTLPTNIQPIAAASGGIYIRRVRDRTMLCIEGAKSSGVNPTISLPTGFSPGGAPYPVVPFALPSGVYRAQIGSSAVFLFLDAGVPLNTTAANYGIAIEWPAFSSWPTALPGTAV